MIRDTCTWTTAVIENYMFTNKVLMDNLKISSFKAVFFIKMLVLAATILGFVYIH